MGGGLFHFISPRVNTSRGGTNTPFFSCRYRSHVFLDIFWTLSPKIIVVLAENQYLGRFKGGYDVINIGVLVIIGPFIRSL